ncbi:hypothetical protein BSKO_00520 [Bryopsis sp. KO-2023]|nr:hypothetical protein BSKO_00520 [Bryopsis sp. KO-2023]
MTTGQKRLPTATPRTWQKTAVRRVTRAEVPRFYVSEPLRSVKGECLSLGSDETRHATRVLRLKVGDKVELCDGRGGVAQGQIAHFDKSCTKVQCSDEPHIQPWVGPKLELAVACGGLKGGRGDWLVEKATELGAFSLIPLLSSRSQIVGGRASRKEVSGRESRWERVAQAAMKQSLRLHALDIKSPMGVEQLEQLIRTSNQSFIAIANAPPVLHALEQLGKDNEHGESSDLLIIGPEGDFTDEEKAALTNAGAIPVGLGTNRLRVETAAIGMLAAFRFHTL